MSYNEEKMNPSNNTNDTQKWDFPARDMTLDIYLHRSAINGNISQFVTVPKSMVRFGFLSYNRTHN